MLLLAFAAGIWSRHVSISVIAIVTWCVLGVAQDDLANRWPLSRDGERIVARCVVDSVPQLTATGASLDAQCRQTLPRDAPEAAQPLHLRVRLPPQAPAALPRAGESWQWLLEVHALVAPLNPGAIDSERQWYRDRVHALARQRPSAFDRRLTTAPPGLLRLRADVAQAVAARVDDRDARALIAALAVGVTGDLTRDQWRVFSATGITHLIAISGMHVTAFALVAIAMARRLWRRAPSRLRERIDRERFALLLGLACAMGYAALAGMSVPTQRTLVMLLIAAAARLSSRRVAPLTLLSLAAVAVLLIDPYAPLAAGFWLSFVAVAVLMALGNAPVARASIEAAPATAASLCGQVWLRGLTWLRSGLAALVAGARLQWLITFAMLPCTLALFGSVPLAGLVANLVAIPLFSLALVPLTLAGLALLPTSTQGIELAAPLWRMAERLWLVAAPLLQRAADWPLALWRPDVSLCWLLVSPVLVLMAWRGLPAGVRCAAIAALAIPVGWAAHGAPPAGAAQVTVLDAGLGDAIIVRTATHSLLFDTADVHGGEGAAVQRLVVPALLALGLRRIDRLVVSSMSASRVIGAATLISSFPVGEVRSAAAWPSADRTVRVCAASERWRWDGVDFSWLESGVAAGCVLRVRSAGGSLLLTGAIDATAQLRMVREGAALRSDVVIVPRHGSAAASTAAFAAAVAPRWAIVISNGAVPDAVALRWRAVGTAWRATRDCGALQFSLSAHQVTDPQAIFDSPWHWPWRAACPRQ